MKPSTKKICISISSLLVIAIASVGLWLYLAFFHTKSLSKAELAELTPDWSVVTHDNWSPWFDLGDGTKEWNPAAIFNAWLATVDENDKAWPMLVDVYYKHLDEVFYYDYLGTTPHDAPQWVQLLKVISNEHSDEILAQLKLALSRPMMGVPIMDSTDPYEHDAMTRYGLEDKDWDPSATLNAEENQNMMLTLLPSLGRHRSTANFLRSRAAYELEAGNVDEFIAIVDLSIHSAKLNLEIPTLIGHLVRVAIVALGFDTIDWAITTHPESFNDAQLAKLDELIAAHSPLTLDWQGEAMMFHDSMRRFADENGSVNIRSMGAWANSGGFNTNGAVPCSLPEMQLSTSLQRPLAIYNIALKRTSELGDLPWDPYEQTGADLITDELGSFHFSVRLVMDLLTPSLERLPHMSIRHTQNAIALRIGIASERHRLRHGVYPASLDEFDADLITIDPIDAFTSEPLKYILKDGKPMIYSVSDDRDDDLGAPMYDYDIDALFETPAPTKNMMKNRLNASNKTTIDTRYSPLWITIERAKEIEVIEPKAVDGDWVLYPIQRGEPEPIEEDDSDWDLEPVPQDD